MRRTGRSAVTIPWDLELLRSRISFFFAVDRSYPNPKLLAGIFKLP
jgi:hypothetical protein